MISIIPARTGIHALANLRCRLEIYLLQRRGAGRRLKAKDFNRSIQLQRTQTAGKACGLSERCQFSDRWANLSRAPGNPDIGCRIDEDCLRALIPDL